VGLASAIAGTTSLHQGQVPTFRTGIRTVPIYATVTAADGRLIMGLTREDFTVTDRGEVRPITVFSNDPGPFTVVALWDVSPAVRNAQARSRASALAFVDALNPDDRMRFGTFSGQEIAFSPHLTSDKALLRRIVSEEIWFSTAGAPIWASLEQSVKVLTRDEGRRVLVVLSPAKSKYDPRSRANAGTAVQRADITVYAIGLEETGLAEDMRDLAADSGGGYAVISAKTNLDQEFKTIVQELRSQYLIGIEPTGKPGDQREISVTVRIPGARVRARRMYVVGG
jgi:VWFA-related protein